MCGLAARARGGLALLLVVMLALLLAPARPAGAEPEPLPGYSVTDPVQGPPVAYEYSSANALAAVEEPTTKQLEDIKVASLAPWGTEENLLQNWKLYKRERAPYVAKPLTWAKYREQYIRIYNSNHIGARFEEIVRGLPYFSNGEWRFNQRLPDSEVNRRPDALNEPELWAQGKNWLWDFKTGAISKDQLKDFLRYCEEHHLNAGIVFDSRPLSKTLSAMNDTAAQVAKELGLARAPAITSRFLNIAPQATPPGPGVLATGSQNPVDGGGGQPVDQSPDSPEDVVEKQWVAQFLQGQANVQPQAPTSAPVPTAAPAPQQVPASQQVPAPQAPAPAPAGPGVPNVGGVPAWPITAVNLANAWASAVASALAAAAGGVPGLVANIAGGVVNGIGGIAAGLPNAIAGGLGGAVPGVVGGVDFSTLELRYIADTDYSGGGVRYAFAANAQPGEAPSFGGHANAAMASDAFFVWLALPTSAFTVNLNPNEPDRIIDAQFGRTDAGRVLLEADYTMKRATAQLVDPSTVDGHRFLDALQGSKCFSPQRKWIVPLPASVAQDGNGMYLLDAPLDVKLEILGTDLKPGIGCPGQDPAITRGNDELYRTTILPKIVAAVNHAAEYADLRRVYASRVAAEWYRQHSATKTTAYSTIVNSGDISAWTSKQPWSPQDIFARYRTSFYQGDATYTWQADERTSWTLTVGGVDFTTIPMVTVAPAEFVKAHPSLPATASDALFGPRFENSGQQVWLGGLTSAQPLSQVWRGDPSLFAPLPNSLSGASLSPILYAVITMPLAAWLGVGGLLW
ncbi:hypothetical protein, partial [Mycobacterium innocens]|uniref:hypothetical protein n=1 Tax=Mycobacterium innocens TaxID=2341083 RepID=UPI001ABF69A0